MLASSLQDVRGKVAFKTNKEVAQRETLLHKVRATRFAQLSAHRWHPGHRPCLPNRQYSLELEEDASIFSKWNYILETIHRMRQREEALAASSSKNISHGITSGTRLCCACAGARCSPSLHPEHLRQFGGTSRPDSRLVRSQPDSPEPPKQQNTEGTQATQALSHVPHRGGASSSGRGRIPEKASENIHYLQSLVWRPVNISTEQAATKRERLPRCPRNGPGLRNRCLLFWHHSARPVHGQAIAIAAVAPAAEAQQLPEVVLVQAIHSLEAGRGVRRLLHRQGASFCQRPRHSTTTSTVALSPARNTLLGLEETHMHRLDTPARMFLLSSSVLQPPPRRLTFCSSQANLENRRAPAKSGST